MRAQNLFSIVAATWLSLAVPATADDANGKLSNCPGYKASNVQTSSHGMTADLHLAGAACNAYGKDLEELRLHIDVETGQLVQNVLLHRA